MSKIFVFVNEKGCESEVYVFDYYLIVVISCFYYYVEGFECVVLNEVRYSMGCSLSLLNMMIVWFMKILKMGWWCENIDGYEI